MILIGTGDVLAITTMMDAGPGCNMQILIMAMMMMMTTDMDSTSQRFQ
jgi:hypothetical protein